ncbi:MAG: DNA polymerase III subunit delta' [bacterium]
MSFSDIVGHQRIIAVLKKALGASRLAHAYLFVGPQGVGKSTTAREFAKAIQCVSRSQEACEHCIACRKVRDGTHPDVIWLERQGKQILVEQVRELQRRLMYRPLEGVHRVAILQDAQDLTLQAGNALLKLLEEPPADTVMVLLAVSEQSLLPTVVSRCQKLRFAPLPEATVSAYLIQRLGWEPQRAAQAARAAQGSIGRALLLEKEDVELLRNEARELLYSIQGLGLVELLEKAKMWALSRQEASARLEAMRSTTREMLLEELGAEDTDENISKRSYSLGRRKWLLEVWEMSGRALEALERNINPQLLLENLLAGIKARAGQLLPEPGATRKVG